MDVLGLLIKCGMPEPGLREDDGDEMVAARSLGGDGEDEVNPGLSGAGEGDVSTWWSRNNQGQLSSPNGATNSPTYPTHDILQPSASTIHSVVGCNLQVTLINIIIVT